MTREIYTIGYAHHSVEEIKGLVESLGAYLVDVRFSPKSRFKPEFAKSNLAKAFGQRYIHLKEWGNANYQGGPVKLVDFDAGRLAIDKLAAPVILMCACGDVNFCHRWVIGRMLAGKGYSVTDIP